MKLNFILQNNGQSIINEDCLYEIIDDEIIFKYQDIILKILVKDGYSHFIRESKTDKLEIKKTGNAIESKVTLLDIPYSADILVKKFDVLKKHKNIIITYTIESDADNEKTIILTLAN